MRRSFAGVCAVAGAILLTQGLPAHADPAPAPAAPVADVNESHAVFHYGYLWKDCEKASYAGGTLPGSENDTHCIPDTLYSWQDYDSHVAVWMKQATPHIPFPAPYLYAWRTPMGSFGYGNALVRLKLFPDTRFVLIDMGQRDCNALNARYGHRAHVIYGDFLNWLGMTEYLVCSAGPVMSWSVNTPESMDEINHEVEWIEMERHENGGAQNWDTMVRSRGVNIPWETLGAVLGNDGGMAERGWSKEALERNLTNIHKFGDRTGIFYSEDVTAGDRAAHFRTIHPGYFNDRPEPGADPNAGQPTIEVTRADQGKGATLIHRKDFFGSRCDGRSWCKLSYDNRASGDDIAIEYRCKGIDGKRFGTTAQAGKWFSIRLACVNDPQPLAPRKLKDFGLIGPRAANVRVE